MNIKVKRFLLLGPISVCLCWCSGEPTEGDTSQEEEVTIGGGKADGMGGEGALSLFQPGNRYGWGGQDRFVDEILPVFARRCATCHGCTDSPCQLKLTSYEGISRGSSQTNIFENRLFSVAQSRMQDGRILDPKGRVDFEASVSEWRAREFYSVTDNGRDSIMYQLIGDEAHTLTPEGGLSQAYELYENGLADRSFECIGAEAAAKPGLTREILAPRAMPFGCQQLAGEDYETLAQWLEEGAYGPTQKAQTILATPMDPKVVARWEEFFNQKGNKARLATRFIYEHLFFARLHFPDSPGEYYEIVRSWTPPGVPIEEVVTELINDDPKTGRPPRRVHGGSSGTGTEPFYRLRKYTPLVVQKNHITWPLDDGVMARWQELLFDSDWGPGEIKPLTYASTNPFEYFESMPGMIRYLFLLEHAQGLIDAMVRGDVCTGSTATYAIRDHFWVWFLEPEADPSALDPKLGQEDWYHLVPGQADTSGREPAYLGAFEKRLRELRPEGLSVEDIWNGETTDTNAWLTILRHGKSASVHQGPANGFPETFWVLSFSSFERLYYNLVVNYNPWKAVLDQKETWEYMSLVRAEGEELFLSFLPEMYRESIRDEWTKGFGRFFISSDGMESDGRPSMVWITDDEDPIGEFVWQIREQLTENIAGPTDRLNLPSEPFEPLPERITNQEELEQGLATLTGIRAPYARYLPNLAVLRVGGEAGWVYTLVANRGYEFHNLILFEDLARDPEQDTVSVNRGLMGAYPELFVDVPLHRAHEFLDQIHDVESQSDWQALLTHYKHGKMGQDIRFLQRDAPEFWAFLDWLHEWNVRDAPVEAGILDVSEYLWPSLVPADRPAQDDDFEPNDSIEEAVFLPLGIHELALCGSVTPGIDEPDTQDGGEDWFAFDVPSSGRLTVEVAFNYDFGDIDIDLTGNGVFERSRSWTQDYEVIAVDVSPGIYNLYIKNAKAPCQAYTLYTTLYENP